MLLASRLVKSGEIAVVTRLNEVCVRSTSFCEEITSSSRGKGKTACWRIRETKDSGCENVRDSGIYQSNCSVNAMADFLCAFNSRKG